jgi:CheY-like chemotaxis protein
MGSNMQKNIGIILVVDDEAAVLSALRREILDIAPVMIAASASEAYGILGAHDISVILSDYKMPGTDGITFLSDVREKYPQITRLLFTAYSGEDLLLDAVNRAGIFHFIKKPWDSASLKITLQRALEFHAMNEEMVRYRQRLANLEDIKKGSLGIISHELKTPLTSLRGYADMMEPYVSDDVERIIYRKMQESLDRLHAFVEHVVDLVTVDSECPDTIEREEVSSMLASLFNNYVPQELYNIDTRRELLFTFLKKFSAFIKNRQAPYAVLATEAGKYLVISVELRNERDYPHAQLPLFEALEPDVNYINYDGEHNLELGYARKAVKCLGGEMRISLKKKYLCFDILLPLSLVSGAAKG